ASKMGEKAAELLINNLEREDEEDIFETFTIQTDLIERESTK
ncbi:MAG: LacI family transcriptional regulator, partial [Mesoflavibacter sp.]|nr:LacI family transcriptional regulator [Mesoflavibacter sp.]